MYAVSVTLRKHYIKRKCINAFSSTVIFPLLAGDTVLTVNTSLIISLSNDIFTSVIHTVSGTAHSASRRLVYLLLILHQLALYFTPGIYTQSRIIRFSQTVFSLSPSLAKSITPWASNPCELCSNTEGDLISILRLHRA